MRVDDATLGARELYWDPWDYGLQADPHPTWRRMREEAPLYYNATHDFWALTRFQDVLDCLVDWKSYSSSKSPMIEIIRGGPINEYVRGLIMEDPPTHTVHRHLLSRTFTPRAVKRIEDRLRAYAQRLLDERVGSGGFDFVDDFGARIPAMVIATMLGTPDTDIEEIRHLTDTSLHIEEGEALNDRDRFEAATNRLGEYFMSHVHARRENPGDDIMSTLVTMEFTDEFGVTRKLHDMEACQYILQLSSAGNETLARFTGWAGSSLARFPEQRAKLVARPELIPNGVEEILRYESPSHALARLVQRDVVWYDQVVPEGAVILAIQAATGRDQRQFADPDPDVLDVERRIDRHLSFGFGPHVCLGASLARLEARIVVEEALARFPEWDVDWDNTDMVHTGSAVRGYSKLPIRF